MSAAHDGFQLNCLEAGRALLHGLVLQMNNATLAGTAGDDSDVPASVLVVRVGLLPVDARLGGVGLNLACWELDVLRVLPMLPRARLGQVSEDPDDVPIPNLCETRRLVRAELDAETEDEAQVVVVGELRIVHRHVGRVPFDLGPARFPADPVTGAAWQRGSGWITNLLVRLPLPEGSTALVTRSGGPWCTGGARGRRSVSPRVSPSGRRWSCSPCRRR